MAHTLTDYDLPPGFSESEASWLFNTEVVIITDASQNVSIALIYNDRSDAYTDPNALQHAPMLPLLSRDPNPTWHYADSRTHSIRGQETTLNIYHGTDTNGVKYLACAPVARIVCWQTGGFAMSASPPSRKRTAPLLIAGGGLAACLCLLAALGLGGYWFFQQEQSTVAPPAVVYILDASPRMAQATEGGTRLSVARAVLAEIVRSADTSVAAALRVFGTGAVEAACQDTELLVPLAAASQGQIAQTLSTVETSATSVDSALAAAMIAGIRDLAQTNGPHTLVVVTGGADSCSAGAGELIRQEAERAGISLQMFVVGFEVDEQEAAAIKAIIAATPGVAYLNAPDAPTLHSILNSIQAYIANPTGPALTAVLASSPAGESEAPTVLTPTADVGEVTAEATLAATKFAGYRPQTACDHPYYPLRLGATWTYLTPNGETTETVESVTGDLANANAVLAVNEGGTVLKYAYTCSPDGILHLGSATHNCSQMSGVNLPNLEALVSDATWSSELTCANPDSGETYQLSRSDTAGNPQTISTPAGSFDVIVMTVNQTGTLTDSYGEYRSTGAGTLYYALGVGLVRSDWVVNGTIPLSNELTTYNIP